MPRVNHDLQHFRMDFATSQTLISLIASLTASNPFPVETTQLHDGQSQIRQLQSGG